MEENDQEAPRHQVIYENPGTLTQVQHLSQIVWDLLMFLPTNSSIRENLETFGGFKVFKYLKYLKKYLSPKYLYVLKRISSLQN